MHRVVAGILSLAASATCGTVTTSSTNSTLPRPTPVAGVKNGSYWGVHNPHYYQDHFLGIPYAQAPVGDLRYRPPASLNSSWTGARNATEFGYACIGYGDDTEYAAGNYTNEDCLTLSILRPAGLTNERHPVAVWIHGGGYVSGSAINPQYNMSAFVQESVRIGKPVIVVSIQYRLAGWGYMWSKDMVREGVANLGVRDQHMALRWVNENIQSFGGDSRRVTIWGESAGSRAVGDQLLAYNGRDDGLFSAAIGQSGAAAGFGSMDPSLQLAEKAYINVTDGVNCSVPDRIACLRAVPTEALNNAINASLSIALGEGLLSGFSRQVYGPQTDGDIVFQDPVTQISQGNFVKVPYISGDTALEGSSFAPHGLDTDKDIASLLNLIGFTEDEAATLLRIYPFTALPDADNATITEIGAQFSRVSLMMTDLMMKAPRRLTTKHWLENTNETAPMYSYEWNATFSSVPAYFGATHWSDGPYVFHSVKGIGYQNHSYPWYGPNPFLNRSPEYYSLADTACRMWISFIHKHDPNYERQIVPSWTAYESSAPQIMRFGAEIPSHIASDDYREEGINFFIEHQKMAGLN